MRKRRLGDDERLQLIGKFKQLERGDSPEITAALAGGAGVRMAFFVDQRLGRRSVEVADFSGGYVGLGEQVSKRVSDPKQPRLSPVLEAPGTGLYVFQVLGAKAGHAEQLDKVREQVIEDVKREWFRPAGN